MDVTDYDWENNSPLRGTVSRIGRWVRGDCEVATCGETNALLYDSYDDETLMCVWCSRKRAAAAPPHIQLCDSCGGEHAWRDPLTRRNEYFCAQCHARNGTVFQNRWANKARQSEALKPEKRAKCALAGYGTDCAGEVKWRGPLKMQACNKHAGRKSANEANN